jgi:hypothetical protein
MRIKISSIKIQNRNLILIRLFEVIKSSRDFVFLEAAITEKPFSRYWMIHCFATSELAPKMRTVLLVF